MELKNKPAFAIWVTGLPASGKSTLAAVLKRKLAERGVGVAVLESDALRNILTPEPRYDDEERERFYCQVTCLGSLLVEQGVPVIFDATANKRRYRDEARGRIPELIEVYVDCPLEVCMARDPKGIYRRGRDGGSSTVPGFQASYEPPENPDVVVRCNEDSASGAARVIAKLVERKYL